MRKEPTFAFFVLMFFVLVFQAILMAVLSVFF